MISHSQQGDFVITDRGGIVENRYSVHAAIVTSTGKILYTVGDPTRITLARSAAKPAQSLAIISTTALEKFHFDEPDLALMCASHNAEDRHLSRARDMLRKSGCTEADLRCGGHPSVNEDLNRQWIRDGFELTPLCNNCSGKHAGMLAGAIALGAGVEGYHLPGHPMQVRVRETVQGLTGLGDEDGLRWGIDGCNLPAPAMPLWSIAQMYAFFAGCTDEEERTGGDGEGKKNLDSRTLGASRVFRAMTRYPELVGGEDRFCTDLMTALKGQLIGKVGADGCYGVGIRASEQTRRLGSDGALGIAVKIEDGNRSILYSAVTEILEQLQIGTEEERACLAKYHRQKILNTWNVVTGGLSHHFKVKGVHQPMNGISLDVE